MISLKLPSETMGGEVIDTGNFYHFLSKDDNCDVDEDNLEVEKVEKGRERNREHAKRTRLRKKAVLEGMKGKLMELQNEASKLQQSFEERNTANILLCLCSKATADTLKEEPVPFDGMKVEAGFDPTVKGNIIQQLRTKVRSEAAQKNQHAALIRSRNNSIWTSDPLPQSSAAFAAYADAVHIDTDCDSDNDDDDAFQPLPKSIVNWKNGTVVSEEGTERKLSDEEMEHLRKERNRVHAKLTRDRKKLFTSRMQQMISSLERQNGMMKNRLKSLATVGEIPMTHDRNRERMRDNRENSISVLLGHQKSSNSTVPSNQQYPSGFPMSVLQALSSSNPNEINTADQISNPVLSLAQTQVLSLSQVADLNTDAHNMNRYKPFSHGCRDQASVANDPNPFLQHLGSLDRTIQTDSNLILHQLGPLSRIRTDPRQLMAPSSNSSSQFTSSSSRSFFEAL